MPSRRSEEMFGATQRNLCAGQSLVRLGAAERVARRMALAAMGQTLDQIGAAVDLSRCGCVRLERSRTEEQLAPYQKALADVEREPQRVRLPRLCHRREREQVSLDRQ